MFTYTFNIDNGTVTNRRGFLAQARNRHAPAIVTFNDASDLANFGGTIRNPERIESKISFSFTFNADNSFNLNTTGLSELEQQDIQVFTGLRDDPFIRSARAGRNNAAIVVQIPLSSVVKAKSTLLTWATTKVDTINGVSQELGARALRSQFFESDVLNSLEPKDHLRVAGVTPDVIIYDTSRPAAFPNGRELTDDVVDLACDLGECRAFDQEDPNSPVNDVPFFDDFPYLGEAQ